MTTVESTSSAEAVSPEKTQQFKQTDVFSWLSSLKNTVATDIWQWWTQDVELPTTSRRLEKVTRRRPHNRWQFRCHQCKGVISERAVRAKRAVLAQGFYWHASHFNCSACRVPIGLLGFPYVVMPTNDVVCVDCHLFAKGGSCTDCQKPLFESCCEFKGKNLHRGCFTCTRCGDPLAAKGYLLIEDKPYDFDCYHIKTLEPLCKDHNVTSEFKPDAAVPVLNQSASSSENGSTPAYEDPLIKRKPLEFCSLSTLTENDPSPADKKDNPSTKPDETGN